MEVDGSYHLHLSECPFHPASRSMLSILLRASWSLSLLCWRSGVCVERTWHAHIRRRGFASGKMPASPLFRHCYAPGPALLYNLNNIGFALLRFRNLCLEYPAAQQCATPFGYLTANRIIAVIRQIIGQLSVLKVGEGRFSDVSARSLNRLGTNDLSVFQTVAEAMMVHVRIHAICRGWRRICTESTSHLQRY